jgi:hypothetical protein
MKRTQAILIFILPFLFSALAFAGIHRMDQDIKLPSQQVLEKQTVTAPIVATTNYIKTTYAGPTSAAALTLTTFTHQPDVPRTITITPTGTTGDVESCAIVVTGTNIKNQTITDTLTFAADASTVQTSVKAFKAVSSVTWPANCESGGFGATWIIGVGGALGLKNCMNGASDFVQAGLNGVFETTRPTVTADATDVSKNLALLNSALNSVDVQLYFMQNFRCLP